jgi:hypothetical protein
MNDILAQVSYTRYRRASLQMSVTGGDEH